MSCNEPTDVLVTESLSNPEALARRIAALALEKKATDVVMLDLRKLTSMCDFFVLASVDSEPQIKAVMSNIQDELTREKQKPWHIEGTENKVWIVMDYVDVVVHVFREETRQMYSLERLWADAPRVEFTN